MIACENPDCETEWFHFACVGLTTEVCCSNIVVGIALQFEQPKDPWYCSVCSGEEKKEDAGAVVLAGESNSAEIQ